MADGDLIMPIDTPPQYSSHATAHRHAWSTWQPRDTARRPSARSLDRL